MSRSRRFDTEAYVVTGRDPDELERRAIERAEQVTGVDARDLAVSEPYRIYAASESKGLADGAVSEVVKRMRATGDKLGARIYVSAYREVSDADTCGVDRDSRVPADTPDLRPAAGPVSLRRAAPLEAHPQGERP